MPRVFFPDPIFGDFALSAAMPTRELFAELVQHVVFNEPGDPCSSCCCQLYVTRRVIAESTVEDAELAVFAFLGRGKLVDQAVARSKLCADAALAIEMGACCSALTYVLTWCPVQTLCRMSTRELENSANSWWFSFEVSSKFFVLG